MVPPFQNWILFSLIVDAFKGIYNRDICYHENDLMDVLSRAHDCGVDKMIIKGFYLLKLFTYFLKVVLMMIWQNA